MNKSNRVLHMCSLDAGGIETFVMNIYRNIDNKKIKFDFINYFDPNKEQFYEAEVLKKGSKVYKTGSWMYKNPVKKHVHRIKSTYRVIKENKYDTVHIHASDNVWIEDAIVAKFAKVPNIIVHSHNSMIPNQEKRYKIKRVFHEMVKGLWPVVATDYFACSDLAAKHLYSKRLIKSNKVKIIKNGIDVDKYKYDIQVRELIRTELNINDKFVVGHIGRFAYQKNHEYLLEIFYEIKNINPDSILLLIGDGELKDEIKEKAKKMNILDSIIFYGKTNEINKLLQVMDVFVLPSHFEGLPLVGIEAQAAGLNLIVSNNVSQELKITENVTFLSLKDSAKIWANEILKSKGKSKSKYTFEDIKTHGYDISIVAKYLEDKYTKYSLGR